MSRIAEIDFVAPPFAGHLFPLLQLAAALRNDAKVRIISTGDTADTIRLCGLEPVELLPGRANEVWAIANTDSRTGFHPLRLHRQFRANMALMADAATQLRELWRAHAPDLVVADFTVPVAGLTARELGIRWWTSMPSPCALETRRGTPSYLGGWSPAHNGLTRLRDAIGRGAIRTFKRGIATLFAKELRAIGFASVHRDDGTEAAYSDDRILALGMRELELERDWPHAVQFIGPLTAAPPFAHTPPHFPDDRRAILVTLGTHLPWARERAIALIEEVAAAMPDCIFHFAGGIPGSRSVEIRNGVVHHGFIPYDRYLARYSAAIIHGGTGITYACIEAGVPMLVWPHDYDQHDHAARIVHGRLGERLVPRRDAVIASLRRLMSGDGVRTRELQQLSRNYDPIAWLRSHL